MLKTTKESHKPPDQVSKFDYVIIAAVFLFVIVGLLFGETIAHWSKQKPARHSAHAIERIHV